MKVLYDNHTKVIGNTVCTSCGSVIGIENTDDLNKIIGDQELAAFVCPCCGATNILKKVEAPAEEEKQEAKEQEVKEPETKEPETKEPEAKVGKHNEDCRSTRPYCLCNTCKNDHDSTDSGPSCCSDPGFNDDCPVLNCSYYDREAKE